MFLLWRRLACARQTEVRDDNLIVMRDFIDAFEQLRTPTLAPVVAGEWTQLLSQLE